MSIYLELLQSVVGYVGNQHSTNNKISQQTWAGKESQQVPSLTDISPLAGPNPAISWYSVGVGEWAIIVHFTVPA